jgi:hypothetical protein
MFDFAVCTESSYASECGSSHHQDARTHVEQHHESKCKPSLRRNVAHLAAMPPLVHSFVFPLFLRLPSPLTIPPFLPAALPPAPRKIPATLTPAINNPVTTTNRIQKPASSSISFCAIAMAAWRRVWRRASSYVWVRWMGWGSKSVFGGGVKSGPGPVVLFAPGPAAPVAAVLW